MADMPRPRPPYLHPSRSRHGKQVWYVRVGARGRKIRIREKYGTPEFDAAYRAAVSAGGERPIVKPAAASGGTLGWLWMLYRQTGAWTGLKAPTRKQRENIMRHVLETAGEQPLSAIGKTEIIDGIDRRAATPFQAKNFLTTMRGLFEWAFSKNLVSVDPTSHGPTDSRSGPKRTSKSFSAGGRSGLASASC